MLAKRRLINLKGADAQRTPLLVPSFSSKGFSEVSKIVDTTKEVIEGAMLVSAYDLHYREVAQDLSFAELIFLDSGGYEASKDTELSDFGEREYQEREWTQVMHETAIAGWTSPVPTVLISYDNPSERLPIRDQIERARRMAPGRNEFAREILLKPSTKDRRFLDMDEILRHARALSEFDVIGVTEKEVGSSIFGRMENIAKLRLALTKVGLETPIHVFGSLDTVATPMYFLAGADIFDGLTWLRFAYHDGYTMYKHNFGALTLGVTTKAHLIDVRTWYHNYRYLVELELEMRRFLNEYDFKSFKFHSELFKDAHASLIEAVGA
jgi:hypothetical protein